MKAAHPLRPFLLADTVRLQDLFAQAIEELTRDDYDDEQRLAWISQAEDSLKFGRRLAKNLTLVVEEEGELVGFASLKDNKEIDMLYVHPFSVGEGIGSNLLDALERLAAARGTETVTADVSDTAHDFFQSRGYQPVRRNNIPVDDVWLSSTTMTKSLKPGAKADTEPS